MTNTDRLKEMIIHYKNNGERVDEVLFQQVMLVLDLVNELKRNLANFKQWEFETAPYVDWLEIQNQRYRQTLECIHDSKHTKSAMKIYIMSVLENK